MNIEQLIADLRARINPQYYDQIGTESYERHQVVKALEYLATENERLKEAQEQEPVAWLCGKGVTTHKEYAEWFMRFTQEDCTPLYARPVPSAPAEDLTEMRRVISGVADRLGLPTENGNRLHDLSFWLDSPPAVPEMTDDALEEILNAAQIVGYDDPLRIVRGFAMRVLQEWGNQEGMRKAFLDAVKPAVAVPAVPDEWREVLRECADDLAIELDQRYGDSRKYPSEQRKYEAEMQPVYRALALLQSTGDKK